ncbi:MAG: 5'-3' exonuclease H3TH domain-containing protein, partial [Bacteroidota bacterium]
MPDKKLVLFDAMAIIYRAHFAFSRNPRINSKGLNTGAVLGFTNTILDVIKKEEPTHVGVACDAKGPTFRHEKYEPYKAHREAQPEDITLAIPYVFKVIEAMGIPLLIKEGYEADDIVGTLAKQAADDGFEVQMVTIDKDYAQLVDETVFLYKLPYSGRKEAEKWGIPEVQNRWNIERPEQVADILGLQGDASDNIPGIPGIGEKTAMKLVGKYGSVEGLIENVNELKGKQKQNVTEFAEQGLLSKKLATIYTEAPVDFSPDALVLNDYKKSDALRAVFAELEFRTLSKRVFGEDVTKKVQPKSAQGDLFGNTEEAADQMDTDLPEVSIPEAKIKRDLDTSHHDYHLMDTPELRAELIEFLKLQDMICVDTETTSLNELEAEVVGLAICYQAKEAFYVPCPPNFEETKAILEEFKEVLENPEVVTVGQNIKYDLLVLQNYGIELQGKFFDTMIAHYLLEPDRRHGLDVIADDLLNYKMMPITELIGKKGKNQGNMRDLAP